LPLITAAATFPQVTAAEKVHVKMWHLLMSGRAGIGEDTVAGFGYSLLPSNMPEGADQSGNLGSRGFLGEVVERGVLALGDHQNMRRALRADIVECEDVFVLINLLARDFAAQDAGEDIVAVVGHHASGQRFARERFSSIPDMSSRRASSAAMSAGDTPAAAHSTSRW